LPESSRSPGGSAISAIALLAVAGFAAQAMVRSTDSLLPQIAADLQVSVGATSIVVTAYLLAHGSVQLVIGPIGDRFGKYFCVAIAAAFSTAMVVACGLASSLPNLVAARLACGLATGWIVPFALAFVGDVILYERRQQVLGRFLSGQILGQMFGQAAGGVLGDYFGWRNVFFILAALLATATLGLFYELWRNPITRVGHASARPGGGFVADYSMVLRSPWARTVIAVGFIEAAALFGAFTYVGADLHTAFRRELRAGRPVRRHIRGRRLDLQYFGTGAASGRSALPAAAASCLPLPLSYSQPNRIIGWRRSRSP
jgi:predicted MFS family arabinose efflux permease